MTIVEHKAVFDKFAQWILEGVRKANRKMAEAAALNAESLVVSGKDGKPISVPAKELLKNLAD